MEIKNLDSNLKIYLGILIISWIVIAGYLIYIENENDVQNTLKSYPYEHSKITDSTLKNGK